MSDSILLETHTTTSPRKLQEMSLPTPDGHDITAASGISMKQYEEQLNGLKKENFHLKLRIYFLEEKLGSGSPPAVQGLLEHNVRLQVEVEELRRQLTDKQELLAAAAEAIDVLEQQGSISNDSVENSMNQSSAMRKEITGEEKNFKSEETTCFTCPDSESAADYLAVTVNNDDLNELVKLRRENHKALQMIKGCMKKIQQQDKEIKKLKLDKELVYAQVSDTQLEKYAEILKCKDEHIKDLENKVREFQKQLENVQSDESTGNLQQLLTRRLQGLAYFLDKLLSHKCVLGEEKKKLAESILEQSLALPVGLQLDESMAPGDMDESTFELSQSLRMEDLTIMLGHHMSCNEYNNRNSFKKPHKQSPQLEIMSESEAWSEPDRNVSLARIGLNDISVNTKEMTSDSNKQKLRRSRISHGSRSDDNKPYHENILHDKINELMNQNEMLQEEQKHLLDKVRQSESQINILTKERDEFKTALASETNGLAEANRNIEIMKTKLFTIESRFDDITKQLADAVKTTEMLRTERHELELTFLETERHLRRSADEAAVQASEAALDRAKAQHDKMRIEKELEEIREKLARALEAKAQLEVEITKNAAVEVNNRLAIVHEAAHSEEDRPMSPDQGIDSDRLSSLEHNDAMLLSPRSLYEENMTLKQKLARTKATLAETLAQLNAANMRKISVQRAICREIHKTNGVLRKARDQFENQNQ